MIAGQESIRGKIQDVLCPVTNLYISQGSNTGNHIQVKATDISNGDNPPSKAPYYAPCDIKCVAQILANGQSYWQSINKVRIATGEVCYISFITAHDETINYGVGFTAKQGEQIGNMGIKSSGIPATGNHLHIQFAKGQYGINDFLPNKSGVGMFPNELEIEDTCFMDNTNIINGFAKWKYLKDVPVVEEIDYKTKYNEELAKNTELSKQIESDKAKIDNLTNLVSAKDNEVLILKQENVLLEEKIEALDKEISGKEVQYQVELDKKDKIINVLKTKSEYKQIWILPLYFKKK